MISVIDRFSAVFLLALSHSRHCCFGIVWPRVFFRCGNQPRSAAGLDHRRSLQELRPGVVGSDRSSLLFALFVSMARLCYRGAFTEVQ